MNLLEPATAASSLNLARSVMDEPFNRHPIARLLPWLRSFAVSPEGRER